MEPERREKGDLLLALLLASAGALSLGLGLATLFAGPLRARSGGLLALALPWLGAVFYGPLALLAARSPRSPWISRATGLFVFAHASLVAESLIARALCWGCLAVAGLAFAAGGTQAFRSRPDRLTVASGLLFGAAAAFFSPFDRVDDWLTRTLWPARVLEQLPSMVDRAEISRCEHPSSVRVFLYEKDCES